MTNKNIIFLITLAAIILMITVSGCTQIEKESPKNGDTVSVYYKGTLDDGSIFDEKIKGADEPLTFVLGNNKMIPGFENAILTMKEGETKTVYLTPDEAYGEYSDDYIFPVNRSIFPDNYTLIQGNTEYLSGNNGNVFKVTILNFTDSEVILDANNDLAGKNLTFEITLDKIEPFQ